MELTKEEKTTLIKNALHNLLQQKFQVEIDKSINIDLEIKANCDEKIARLMYGIKEIEEQLKK